MPAPAKQAIGEHNVVGLFNKMKLRSTLINQELEQSLQIFLIFIKHVKLKFFNYKKLMDFFVSCYVIKNVFYNINWILIIFIFLI